MDVQMNIFKLQSLREYSFVNVIVIYKIYIMLFLSLLRENIVYIIVRQNLYNLRNKIK